MFWFTCHAVGDDPIVSGVLIWIQGEWCIMSDKMASGSVYEGEMSVLIKSYKQAIKINNQSISTFTYIKNISSLIRRAFTNNLFPYTLIDKNGTSTTCKNTYFNIMQTSKTSGDVGRIMVQALLKFRYKYRTT